MGKPHFFLMIAIIAALAGAALWAVSPALNSVLEKPRQPREGAPTS
jgi:hypothetical protein